MIRLPDTLYYKINSLLLSSSSKPNKKKEDRVKSKYLKKTNLESWKTPADLVLDFLRFPWFGKDFSGDFVWELLFSFLLINQNTKSRSSSSFDDFNYPNTEQNKVFFASNSNNSWDLSPTRYLPWPNLCVGVILARNFHVDTYLSVSAFQGIFSTR